MAKGVIRMVGMSSIGMEYQMASLVAGEPILKSHVEEASKVKVLDL